MMCILSNILTYCMGEVDFMASSLKVSLSNLFSDLTPGLFINGSVISLEMCFHHKRLIEAVIFLQDVLIYFHEK